LSSTHIKVRGVTRARLTPRERQIAAAVATGCANRRIAARLAIREQTVKNQLRAIYLKVGVRNRTELAVLTLRDGSIGRDGSD
jgi:DNA-binding NarL/FixJ family response regulator